MAWELTGNSNTNPATDFLGTTDNQPLIIKINGTEVIHINVDDTPSSKLQIFGQHGLTVTGFQPFITLQDANAGNACSIIQGANGDIGLVPNSFIGGGAALVAKTGSGNIGIGTSDPSSRLEIAAQDGLKITGFQPFITLQDTNAGNARGVIQCVDGDIIFHAHNSSRAALVAKAGSGDIIMNGNLTVAKDIVLSGADCAEHFDIASTERTEPGAVMVVNAEGSLEVCRVAYDKKVAGVISGAGNYKPGIVLDKQHIAGNRQPIALMGKVFCKVDAQFGAIEVGDLLTTSPTPGHAMKTSDPLKAFGAVLGKALQPLTAGQGLIPILVALQ